MKIKLILSFFVIILLIGIVLPAGETTSETIDVGIVKEIGNLIGPDIATDYIIGNGINFAKSENENTLTFLKGGSAKIGESDYKNVEEGSSIKLDNAGKITFADLTASEDAVFTFDKTDYKLLKGGRIKYEGGKAVIYGNEGSSFEFKEKSSGTFTDISLLGKSVEFEKSGENSILTGNFKIGEDEIKGLDGVGRATLSKNGRILEIGQGTDATIGGINNKVSGENLKMYYEDNFNPLEYKNENYINYGKEKISANGTGFSFNLGKTNKIFGDMKTNFEVTLNGGNMEISKDATHPDLAFKIESNEESNYEIKNGRTVIYSEKGYTLKEGKVSLSDENSIFVEADYKDDLSSSYDINLDNKYKLEDNLFKDNNENVLVNLNTPWETTSLNVKSFDPKLKEQKIQEIESLTGYKTFKNWSPFLKDKELAKQVFVYSDTANNNKYGTTISSTELFATAAGEGMFAGGADSPYERYKLQQKLKLSGDASIISFTPDDLGITYLQSDLKALRKGGFISPDTEFYADISAVKAEDAFKWVAAELAYKKYLSEVAAKKYVGEKEYGNWPENKKFALVTYFFNAGQGTGEKSLQDGSFEEFYNTPVKEEDSTSNANNPHRNVKIREAIYLDTKDFFTFP